MVIPLIQTRDNLNNFAVDELDPVISLKTDTGTLAFHLDFGATSTQLYSAYFNKYRSQIIVNSEKETVNLGGAGGMKTKEVYIIPKLNLYIGNKKSTIDSISVLTQKNLSI